MASFNKVILMGNLTRDPDVRATGASGMKVARLGLAVNERRRDRNGQMQDFPVFVDVDAWDKLAELGEGRCQTPEAQGQGPRGQVPCAKGRDEASAARQRPEAGTTGGPAQRAGVRSRRHPVLIRQSKKEPLKWLSRNPAARKRPALGPNDQIDVNDIETLKYYITDYGKILPARITGVTAAQQRQIRQGVKRARNMGLMA